jgi:hypothetical protein
MNKKLLFAAMSLAALTACTNDDFESKQVAQEASPIQFEVLNNDAATRASMDGNKIVWNANDGDIFTLYHGGAGILGFENAIYTAKANEGSTATLTTPTMIKQGLAVMVWPVDTTFRIGPADNLSIEIPADQKADIENYIPYMSDQITIGAYGKYNEDPADGPVTAWNTAGKDRKYPVFMRPMASQLTVKADYAGTDATLATLYAGDDPIEEIKVTSVELLTQTAGADEFTTNIDVKWTAPTAAINTQWAAVAHSNWTAVTDFDLTAINATSDYLETVCLDGNESAKFLILPQGNIAGGVDDGAVVVNTIYGKVFIGDPAVYAVLPNKSYYLPAEYNKAWYRYISAASKAAGVTAPGSLTGYDASETVAATAGSDGKFKTTSKIENGLMQTINVFSNYTHQGTSVVKGEPEGVAATRYVEVRLNHLDMSDLHIKSDKQLRDAARVWQKMGLPSVTVFVDGAGTANAFVMSQKTIETINAINAAELAAGSGRLFTIQPCAAAGEVCDEIWITGGGKIQDMAFILKNGAQLADVVLTDAAQDWVWDGTITVNLAGTTGISSIINRATLANAEDKILDIVDIFGANITTIPVKNDVPGKWNITAKVRVQNEVENLGKLNIASGAQYLMDGETFTNDALTLENRFIGGSGQRIGKVENKGVFATNNGGTINNYSLIEHADVNAKTYVTTNQLLGNFAAPFARGTNMMGRINLPWSNKDEDNVSVSAALAQGFVSVTIDGEATGALNAGAVGSKVNYVIVKSGPTSIANLAAQVDYLEVDMTSGSELAWSVTGVKNFKGLVVLSDVNIKLGTTVNVSDATYLSADAFMYVGGVTNITNLDCSGYYGNTNANYDTNYITY